MQNSRSEDRWARVVQRFGHATIFLLTSLLMVVVAIATVELGVMLIRDGLSFRDGIPLNKEEIFEAYAFFLLILIGLDLINLLHVLYREGVVRVEFVVQVALISVAQNLIILDAARTSPMTMLSLATLVFALAVAIRAIRGSRGDKPSPIEPR